MNSKQDMALSDKILAKWIKKQNGSVGWLNLPILLSMVAYSATAKATDNSGLVKLQGYLVEPGKQVEKVVVLKEGQVIENVSSTVTKSGFQLDMASASIQSKQPVVVKVIAADGTEFTYFLTDAAAVKPIYVSYSSTLHHALVEAGQLNTNITPEQFVKLVSEGGQYAEMVSAAKTVVDYQLPEITTNSVFDIFGHFISQGPAYVSQFASQYQIEFKSSYETLASNDWGTVAEVATGAAPASALGLAPVLGGAVGVAALAGGGGGSSSSSSSTDTGSTDTGGTDVGGTDTGGTDTGGTDTGGTDTGGTDTGGTVIGGGGTGGAGTGGAEPDPVTISGVVSDGYIKGATVFYDKDGDRVQDADEVGATTDQYGRFTLEEGEGELVSIGGVDTSTNQAVTQVFVAPQGATQVNPFTTMAVEFMGSGLSEEAALDKVAEVFGLDENIDLLQTDLLGDAVSDTGDVNAALIGAQVQAVALATVVEQLTRLLVDSYDGSLTDAQIKQVSLVTYDVVSQALLNSTISLDATTDSAGEYAALFVTAAEAMQNALTAAGTGYQIVDFDANFGASVNGAKDDVGAFVESVLNEFESIDTSSASGLEDAVVRQVATLDTLSKVEQETLALDAADTEFSSADFSESSAYRDQIGNFTGIAPQTEADEVAVAYTSEPIQIDVLENDAIDGDVGTLRVVANEGAGYTVSDNGQSVYYTLPTELSTQLVGETNELEFSYVVEQVVDGEVVGRSFETVTITVNGTYERPTASVPDVTPVAENGSTGALDLLAGSNGQGELTVVVLEEPNGEVALESGVLTYTPGTAFDALAREDQSEDQLVYVLQDGNGIQSLPVTLSFTINGENDTPVVQNVTVNGIEGIDVIGQLFAADADNKTSELSFELADAQPGDRTEIDNGVQLELANDVGVFTLANDGSYRFEPGTGYDPDTGLDISYQVSDGTDTSAPASLTLVLAATNTAPVADSQSLEVAEDTPLSGVLTATDTENAELTYSTVGNAVGGAVELQGDGSFVFTPASDYVGEASFQFVAYDGLNYSAPQTVTITVAPENDAPAASDVALVTDENQPVSGVLEATDIDNETLTFMQVGEAENGTVVLEEDGSYTFTPDANFFGSASFQYQVSDGSLESAVRTATVDVSPLATTPTLNVDHSVLSPTEIGLTISAEAVNPARGEAVFVRITGLPEGATLSAGTPDNGTYLLDTSEIAGLVLTTANASDVVELQVEAYALLNGVSSNVASEIVSEAARKIADTPDVTVAANAVQEDNALSLDIQVASGEAAPEASEETFEIILSDIPDGYTLRADGAEVTVTNGTATFSNDDLVEGTVPDLTISAPANVAESVELTVAVRVTEPSTGDTAESSQAVSLTFNPVVDGIEEITVTSVSGPDVDEESTVDLNISADLLDSDGSESLVYQLSGVPATATLNAGLLTSVEAGLATYLLSAEEAAGLQITLPENPTAAAETYTLTATAFVSEQGVAEPDSSVSETIVINSASVADEPILTVTPVQTQVSQEVALDIDTTVSANDTLTVELSGYPEGTLFSSGTENTGVLTLLASDLDDLTMTLPEGADDFDLAVSAFTTSGTDESESVSQTLAVDVVHAPETPVVVVTPSDSDNSIVIDVTSDANTQDLDIVISGLPFDAYVVNSAGETVGAGGLGIWVLDEADLDAEGLTVVSPLNVGLSADISVAVTAKNTDSGLTASAEPVAVTVNTVLAVDPVVLDLNGDATYDVTSVVDGATAFDMDADGDADTTAWIGPEDGLLVHDLNNNGQIDGIGELFSEHYAGGSFESGSAALASIDSNQDGIIDNSDSFFEELRVWVDSDQSGTVDAGELSTLADLNITEINTDTAVTGGQVNGNTIVGEGQFTIDGEVRSYADVALNYYPVGDASSNTQAPDVSSTMPQISAGQGAESISIGLSIEVVPGTIPFVIMSGVTGGVLSTPATAVPGTTDQYMLFGDDVAQLSQVNFHPDPDFTGEVVLNVASMAFVPSTGGMQYGAIETIALDVFSAATVEIEDVRIDEDQSIALPLTLSYEPSSAQELDQLTVSGIPAGASLSVGDTALAVVDGVAVLDGSALSTLLNGAELRLTPAANNADDFELSLETRVSDLDSDAVAVSSTSFMVTVDAVADAPTITLQTDTFDLSAGQTVELGALLELQDQDGSEYASILVSGLPTGAMLTQGIPFGGTYYLTPDQLASANLVVGNSGEDFSITITAISTEVENGDSQQVIGTIAVSVEAPLQAPTVELSANEQVEEDISFNLTINTSQPQSGETITVNLSGLPEGADLVVNGVTVSSVDGVYGLASDQLEDVSVRPPQNYSGDLNIVAVAVAELEDQEVLSDEVAVSVNVVAVADVPQLASIGDLQVEESGSVNMGLSSDMLSVLDTDGSELLALRIAGLPDGAYLSAGKTLSDGSVVVKPADLSGLSLIVEEDVTSFELQMSAVSRETSNGSLATSDAQSVHVEVTQVAEVADLFVAASTGNEDSPIALDIDVVAEAGESVTVFIRNVPEDVELSAGVRTDANVYQLNTDDLNDLTLTAANPGSYELVVDVETSVNNTTQSNSALLTVDVEAVADVAVINAPALVTAVEGELVAFDIEISLPEGSDELVALEIAGLPSGALLVDQGGTAIAITDGIASLPATSLDIVNNMIEGLQLQAPSVEEASVEYALTVTATTTEQNGDFAVTEADVNMVVNDQFSTVPGLLVNVAEGIEDSAIALDIQVMSVLPESQLTVVISNLLEGATLSAGQLQDDGYHLALSQLNNLTLNAPENFNGDIFADVRVEAVQSSGEIVTAADLLKVSVLPVNDTPIAQQLTFETNEDEQLFGALQASDVDNDESEVLFELVSGSEKYGTVELAADGQFEFTPASNFSGLASFSYRAFDGTEYSEPQLVQISVASVNDAPVGGNDSTSVQENSAGIDVLVLSNDSDVDAFDLPTLSTSYLQYDEEQGGSILVSDDGLKLRFEPNGDFEHLAEGEAETVFAYYKPVDEQGVAGDEWVMVSITVQGSNDLPAVSDVAVSAIEDGEPVIVALDGTDPDTSDLLSYEVQGELAPEHGALTNNGDGTLTFTPGAEFQTLKDGETIEFSLDYKAIDDNGGESVQPASVTITVTGVNDNPDAADQQFGITENSVLSEHFAGSDVDRDAVLRYEIVSDLESGNGSVILNESGGFDFDPGMDFDALPTGESRTVSFSYRSVDEHGAVSEPAEVSITVTGTNDAPTSADVSVTTDEDQPTVSGALIGSDIDADEVLSYALVGDVPAELENLSIADDGSFSAELADSLQTLAAGEEADLIFSYQVSDDEGLTSEVQDVTVTVTGINDAPVADDMSVFLEASAAQSFTFDATDADATDTLTYTIVDSAVGDGVLTNNGDGTFSYDPNGAYDHLAGGQQVDLSFQYFVTDSQGVDSAIRTVDLRIVGENTPPTADGFQVDVAENSIYEGELQGTDSDFGAQLSYVLVDGPDSVTVNADGTFSFDPSADFDDLALGQSRDVTFTYQVTDEFNETSAPATVTLQVQGANDTPLATEFDATASEDGPAITADFIAGDVDSGSLLSFEIVQGISTEQGVLTNNDDGTFSYDPNGMFESLAEGEEASVTFTYRAVDEHNSASAPATVTLTIQGSNDAPVVAAVVADAMEDGATVTGQLVGSDSDNNAELTYELVDDLSVGEGSVTLNANGSFHFTPGQDFQSLAEGETQDVSFSYRATDERSAQSNVELVTVSVTGVNDAPVAAAVAANATEDGDAITINFAGSDVDGDTDLVYSITTELPPGQGELINNHDGSFTFNPGADFQTLAAGDETDVTFRYTVTDKAGAGLVSNEAQITLTLSGTNDAPEALEHSATVRSDESGLLTVNGQLDGLDIDGDAITYELVTDTLVGTLTLDSVTGEYSYSYDPDAGDFSDASFQYRVFDGSEYSEPALVQLLGNTIIAEGLDPKEVRGSEVDENIYLIDSGYTVNAGSGNDLIAMLSSAVSSESHALLGGSGQDQYVLVAQADQELHVNAVIADYDEVEGDKIDLSQLRTADGEQLDLDDLVGITTQDGVDLLIDLDGLKTVDNQNVSGEIEVIGGNMNEIQFVFDPTASVLSQLDELDPIKDYIS